VAVSSKRKADILNSWKEIASYLDRGVRTVQRWERDSQLPVHRLGTSKVGPVFAFPSELDLWLNGAIRSTPRKQFQTNNRPAVTRDQVSSLAASFARSRLLMRQLSDRAVLQQQRTQKLLQTVQILTQHRISKSDRYQTQSGRVA
jgi:hypothetical protein